jgi:Tfp pilus assembly protein PilE
MSDVGGGLDVPASAPPPAGGGIWARFLASPLWVKIAIPVVVVALVTGIVALIASNNSSSSSSDSNTEKVLALMAAKMAANEAAASTTVAETTTTVAETTTTEEETTTTEAETTVPETTTTVPETTTTVTPTTVPVPPTTPPPPPTPPPTTAAPPTEPPTTEAPPTEPPPTEAPPTEAPTTEAPTTEAPPTEPPTTEAPPTEPPTTEPVAPPGALFASLEAFQAAWNAAAQGTSVGQITSWSPIDVNGTQADMATIGGNLRVGTVLRGQNGAVTQVALGWLPLADDAQQAAQNAAFNDAFAVLVRTVNPGASAGQQSGLASQLGISSTQPPFPTGTSNAASLDQERYVLEAVEVPGQNGPVTIVGARLDVGR